MVEGDEDGCRLGAGRLEALAPARAHDDPTRGPVGEQEAGELVGIPSGEGVTVRARSRIRDRRIIERIREHDIVGISDQRRKPRESGRHLSEGSARARVGVR